MINPARVDWGRTPLREAELRRDVVVPGALWTDLRVVDTTASTNADLSALARAGASEGMVLTAECQVAGRGRLGRQWQSPRHAGIAVSVLLRPGQALAGQPGGAGVPVEHWGWVPLLAGVALARTVRRVAGVDAWLKWPNDLLINGLKCAGILAETSPGPGGDASAVVVGIGLNTTLRAGELPHPQATSLALAGAALVDRERILTALLSELGTWYTRWRAAAGDPVSSGLLESYADLCGTLGSPVRVHQPHRILEGTAVEVDPLGRLVVADPAGSCHRVAVGDVVHVRPASEDPAFRPAASV